MCEVNLRGAPTTARDALQRIYDNRHAVSFWWRVGVPNSAIAHELHELSRRNGLPLPEIALVASSSLLRVSRVATSRLVGVHSLPTLLSLAEARDHLAILQVNNLLWKRPVAVVYRRSGRPCPAVRRFIGDLKRFSFGPADRV
jgi:DNA-binding transcriptional LysR family regulator